MSSRGVRTVVPGCEGGRNKQKYRCQAIGCSTTPRGNDLMNHYKWMTDWQMFDRMKAAVGNVALAKLLVLADPHKVYF